MNVAKSPPKPSDTAIGTMNAASRLRFHISGARPKKVVSEVSRMGRKRWTSASRTASARPAVSNSRRSAGPAPACRAMHPTSVCVARARLMKVDHDQTVVDHDAGQRHEPEHRHHRHVDAQEDVAPDRPMSPNGMAVMMMSGCT